MVALMGAVSAHESFMRPNKPVFGLLWGPPVNTFRMRARTAAVDKAQMPGKGAIHERGSTLGLQRTL